MSYSGFREQIRCIVSIRVGWVCDITSIRQSKQTYSWPLVYYGGAIRGGKTKIYFGRSCSTIARVAYLRQ